MKLSSQLFNGNAPTFCVFSANSLDHYLPSLPREKTINKKQEMRGMRKLRFTLHWRHDATMLNIFCDIPWGSRGLIAAKHLQSLIFCRTIFSIYKVSLFDIIQYFRLLTLTTCLSLFLIPFTFLHKGTIEKHLPVAFHGWKLIPSSTFHVLCLEIRNLDLSYASQ